MQIRGLIIALSLLAALSGLLWWSNQRPAVDPNQISDANREQLMTLLNADLVEVTVAPKGEPPLRLRRNAANQWEMVLDSPLPTSPQDAAGVVTNVATISSDQIVEESASDLAQFGLDPGEFVLTTKDRKGRSEQLIVGEATPVGNKFYARRPKEKKVFAIPQYFVLGFNKRVNDLRDKRLVPIDEPKLTRLEFKRGGTAVEFVRGSSSPWKIEKPQPFRIDLTAVDGLITKVKELNFDPTLSQDSLKKYQAAFASASPLALMVLKDGAAAKQLEIRKAKDGGLLAQSSAVQGIYPLAADLASAFEKSLEDFRSRKLMDFGFDDPKRVQLDSGGKTNVLERKGEDWIWDKTKADSSTVTGLLEALRGFSALGFVENKFTTPTFTVTLLQKDGKTIEKLEISKSNNFHYARRAGEAGEYEIDPKTLSDLEAAISRVKPAGSAKK